MANLQELFPLPSENQWLTIIQKELKNLTYHELLKKNEDNVLIKPIYTQSDVLENHYPQTAFPDLVSYPSLISSNYILYVFTHLTDFQSFISKHPEKNFLISLTYQEFLNHFQENNAPNWWFEITDFIEHFEAYWNLISTNKKHQWIINSAFLQECGSTGVDAVTAALLIAQKVSKNNHLLKVFVGAEWYAEIAKIRAINAFLQKYGYNHLNIWAKTAHFNKSLLQMENNLIRLTTEVTAAVLSGSKLIEITPFTLDSEDTFALRIGYNILQLLKHESYLHLVSDALRGSYAIESLTQSYNAHFFNTLIAWRDLSIKALPELWKNKAHENLRKVLQKYQSKEKSIIGVNKYAAKNSTQTEVTRNFPEHLEPVRLAQLL